MVRLSYGIAKNLGKCRVASHRCIRIRTTTPNQSKIISAINALKRGYAAWLEGFPTEMFTTVLAVSAPNRKFWNLRSFVVIGQRSTSFESFWSGMRSSHLLFTCLLFIDFESAFNSLKGVYLERSAQDGHSTETNNSYQSNI